jgi:UDP-N-acetylglucosamine--N-acetylmuramyl-(pentapeptide) pyrophosphoryl-undecaprenol N-acetylglucosamine transferase
MFAGGGTGGHLYPGLAIARAMQRRQGDVDVFFVGAQRGIERQVLPETGFRHVLLDLHPLYRTRPWENLKTLRGGFTSWRALGRRVEAERPDVVVGTGGYASGVALAYAVTHGIPAVIQEQNSFPGLTTRFFSRYATQIHLGFPEAAARLHPGRKATVFESGNPIEPPPEPRPDRAVARIKWGFAHDGGKVMLIYGGSQGSKAMNDVVARWVQAGIPENLRIIWATGRGTHASYASLDNSNVRITPYLSPVSDAYAASDFALSRGGAMATAELCAWGIPPIVVPLPTAAADHQTSNAVALAAAGAGEMIRQSDLTPESLEKTVRQLIENPRILAERSAAVLRRARPHAADEIARNILEI